MRRPRFTQAELKAIAAAIQDRRDLLLYGAPEAFEGELKALESADQKVYGRTIDAGVAHEEIAALSQVVLKQRQQRDRDK